MQQISTRVFVASSIAFGLIGASFFLGLAVGWNDSVTEKVFAIWGVTGCVVPSSFALSVASKYLKDGS